jgi:hypothetical protein
MNTRHVIVVAGAGVLALSLTACAEAQQAIDTAQAAVSTGQAMLDACTSASAAWEPGTTAAEATDGLNSAAEQLRTATESGVSIPGAAALLDAIDTSLAEAEDVTGDVQALATTAAVKALCSALPQ